MVGIARFDDVGVQPYECVAPSFHSNRDPIASAEWNTRTAHCHDSRFEKGIHRARHYNRMPHIGAVRKVSPLRQEIASHATTTWSEKKRCIDDVSLHHGPTRSERAGYANVSLALGPSKQRTSFCVRGSMHEAPTVIACSARLLGPA